jgi:hypothetical protein
MKESLALKIPQGRVDSTLGQKEFAFGSFLDSLDHLKSEGFAFYKNLEDGCFNINWKSHSPSNMNLVNL